MSDDERGGDQEGEVREGMSEEGGPQVVVAAGERGTDRKVEKEEE